jgi:TonB family protein
MSVNSANAQASAQLVELGGKWLLNEYAKNKEISEKTQEIYPTYNDWIKFLEDYTSKTGKVGDCNAIGFRDLSSNRGETKYFSYECGIDGDIAFLNAKNKVKIGKCDEGSVFKAEFDIGKNYLDTRSFPRNDACVFFRPSCRSLIRGFCPSNMVFVGGGTFSMGFREGQGHNAVPEHNVPVNNFCIGKYEVTQKEWQEIMGSNPSNFKNCGGNCPVEQVSWNDVQTFISKLNAKTNMNYRLLTEAEWEYAAQGGCYGPSSWYSGGSSEFYFDNAVWCGKNSNNQTHPVGTKQPNRLGIYDMNGNVWEWVNDWYSDYGPTAVNNYKGASNGNGRVIRGGSWQENPSRFNTNCRLIVRGVTRPDIRSYGTGFRLAHSPVEKEISQNRNINAILINVSGIQTTVKNEETQKGGSSEGMLGGLVVGGSGSIGTKSKGGIRAPSAKDIDMGSGDGSRSRAEIMAIVNQHVNSLKSIYTRYLKDKPGFTGKVTLKFTIAPSGDITFINIVSSTTGYSEFDNAIKEQVSKWKWKQIASGNTTPTIPFDFAE